MDKKNILHKIQEAEEQIKRIEKYIGPGIFRKIKRIIFSPRFYFFYLLLKFGLINNMKKVKLIWGKEMCVNLDDIFNIILYLYGIPPYIDLKSTKFCLKNFKKYDVFYDIGANYGYYTALASEICNEVHSFEPNPYIFNILKENFNKDNIYLNNLAVSDKKGECSLLLAGASSSIIDEVKLFLKTKSNFKNEIKCLSIKLDDYIKNNKPPTFIKMDIEGAEFFAIKGGLNFFKNHSPVILMEVVLNETFGKERQKLSKEAVLMLLDLGFKMYRITESGNMKLIDFYTYKSNLDYDNFVFIKY
ncbi:MAG: FkbM family methyltransferase [candidate division WOR-3 bacterium]